MNEDSIVFRNWPKDYRHFNAAVIKHHIRSVKIYTTRIKNAAKRIEEVIGKENK